MKDRFALAFVAPFLLLALLVACGNGTEEKSAATLRLERIVDPVYIEGAVWGVKLTFHGPIAFDAYKGELVSDGPLSLDLAQGAYRLESYQWPCDGNCTQLGEPQDACSAELRLRRGRETRVVVDVHPGSGCRIRVH